MCYALQQDLIKYNPAYDFEGVVPPGGNLTSLRPPQLKLLPELPERMSNYKGRELTRLALELNLHVFLRSSELRFATG